jgi:hypothetical protein
MIKSVRSRAIEERLEIYKEQRIDNQSKWYVSKSAFNKRRAKQWFWVSVILHSSAVVMLLFRIKNAGIGLPIEVLATSASAALTWLQAKKPQCWKRPVNAGLMERRWRYLWKFS